MTTYNLPANTDTGEGLITRETLLIKPADFQTLAAGNLLALATGRPGAEADYALDHFEIRPYFSSVFSLDDCIREEKQHSGKRAQNSLIEQTPSLYAGRHCRNPRDETSHRYYIGDMPDDMLAANRSGYGYTGIGIVTSAPDKIKLQQALRVSGARHIIQDISELHKILVR